MLSRIFKLLLHLYPDSHRCEFGPEMVSVFEQAQSEAGRQNAIHRAAFALREISALIRDAFRAQMVESASSCAEPWIWSLEAPIAAILLYAFWIWRSEEMGMWGFFFPGTYLLVLVLGGLGAWFIGREFLVVRRWQRWKRAAIVFSILGLSVPISARAVESAWARYVLGRDSGFSFHLPGIQVLITDAVDDGQKQGLTFSRTLTRSDGRPMMMIHHTDRDAPPYFLLGAVTVGILALRSRRTAFTQVPGRT